MLSGISTGLSECSSKTIEVIVSKHHNRTTVSIELVYVEEY